MSKSKTKTRSKLVMTLTLVIALVTTLSIILIATQPELRWRANIIQAKLAGDLPDLDLFWILKMLRPGSPIYLESLASTGNPYAAIKNPLTSQEDVAAGRQTFQTLCSSCHGGDGHAAGKSLFDADFSHGGSDWAIFRNMADGIDGAGMPAFDIPENTIWQIISFIRHEASADTKTDESLRDSFRSLRSVTSERLLSAIDDPRNWLSYSGTLDGQRFSTLDKISTENVSTLKLAWVYQGQPHDHDVESTPLVVDGIMFTTEPPGTVLALDAETGRVLWRYERKLPSDLRVCCGLVNRGVAIANSNVFVGTLDAHVVALDMTTGKVVWDIEVAPHTDGYSKTAAPIVVNDKVIVGIAGGEYGIRGFVAAFDANTGERKWRFNTIPSPGEFGSESWPDDSWKTGGGPTWMTGTYDSDSNLTYWGVGNPGPDFNNEERKGDNLFSNSVVALDANSGDLRWHFQFTPEDVHDYDANSVPVIGKLTIEGMLTKVVMIATKNGFFYVLNAETGEFISALQVAHQTWATGINRDGRPTRNPAATPTAKGTLVHPGAGGGPNWWPPSFNPDTRQFYVPVSESGSIYYSSEPSFEPGDMYLGGSTTYIPEYECYTALRAVDPESNEKLWEFRGPDERKTIRTGGTFTTAGGLVFWGDSDFLFALDAKSGKLLWKANVGGQIVAGPMTYAIGDKQYVAVSAGRGLFVFAL